MRESDEPVAIPLIVAGVEATTAQIS